MIAKSINKLMIISILSLSSLFTIINAQALETFQPDTEEDSRVSSLEMLLKEEIKKNYHGAEVNLVGDFRWVRGALGNQPASVKLLGDDARGNVHLLVIDRDSSKTAEGWIGFSAWLPVKTALVRIKPGQMLQEDQFITQKINVSVGQARDYRGVILDENTDIKGLEAIQTILEGQFLISTSVQRIPDVRRGDSVQIHVITGGLTLTTLGIAEEPSYLNRSVRVMTGKSKRELVGSLLPGRVVEVRL